MELLAWVGEDETEPGRLGIKRGLTPAGIIPLVAIIADRARIEQLKTQMQTQADQYGKTIRLARFALVEDEIVITPTFRPQG